MTKESLETGPENPPSERDSGRMVTGLLGPARRIWRPKDETPVAKQREPFFISAKGRAL